MLFRKLSVCCMCTTLVGAVPLFAKLLIELTFEDGKLPLRSEYPYLNEHGENGGGYSMKTTSKNIRVVSENARSGKYCTRFQVDKSLKRAEMLTRSDPPKCERWFGYSNFIPGDWKTGGWGYYSQWHSIPDKKKGECWGRGPTICMILGGKLTWEIGHKSSPKEVDGCEDKAPIAHHTSLKPIDRGVWVDWVFHIIYDWDEGGTGLIQIWYRKKGETWGPKLYEYRGQLGYNDETGSFWTWGTYEPGSQGHVRVMYYDEIRQGDENSGFLEVQPGQDGTVPPDLDRATRLAVPAIRTARGRAATLPRITVSRDMRVLVDAPRLRPRGLKFDANGHVLREIPVIE